MTLIHALIIAVLQGATELFPVSSLGHAVILPSLVSWAIDQRSAAFLPFLVFLHTGTAIALLVYFWRDWWALTVGVLGLSDAHKVSEARRVFLLIFIATIPASAYDDADGRTITIKAGSRDMSFPAAQYYLSYALPNFFFHMTTAYAILRANGVEVGKGDFIGG